MVWNLSASVKEVNNVLPANYVMCKIKLKESRKSNWCSLVKKKHHLSISDIQTPVLHLNMGHEHFNTAVQVTKLKAPQVGT